MDAFRAAPHVRVLRDPSGHLDLAQAREAVRAGRFEPRAGVISDGYTGDDAKGMAEAIEKLLNAPALKAGTVLRVGLEVHGDGPLVVREKLFKATPLTLAQALDEMELVGHDFFLYVDADTGAPSAVYRRRAYDYGVIHLELDRPGEQSA